MAIEPPNPQECSSNAAVRPPPEHDGRRAFAAWYPQMGGHTGRCIVVLEEPPKGADHGCFDVYIWHDGQSAFDSRDDWGDYRPPTRLHHCSAQQFIDFGNLVNRLAGGGPLCRDGDRG